MSIKTEIRRNAKRDTSSLCVDYYKYFSND